MIFTLISFLFFTGLVAFISWQKTRSDNLETADGYFLAGRGLSGIAIAGSMLLTNISAEQIIGLSGQAFSSNITGMAWESTAAIACVALAVFFLPHYLKKGFTTMPQFLEERYDPATRKFISLLLLTGYVLVTTPGALYAGAVAFNQVFNLEATLGVSKETSIWLLVWGIGIVGSIYAIFGGLKAVAISDTINGIGLIIGGLAVPVFGLLYLGNGSIGAALHAIITTHTDKINAVGGSADPVPFGTIFTGMLFANLFYWCTNQVLIQRTLGAKNLKEGQKGVLLSGFMKLMIPLIVSLPGVIAFHILGQNKSLGDGAYPALVALVLPKYLVGFYSAVIFGAVLSTYNSLLNSAATLFCFDIYKPVFKPDISDIKLIKVAKILGTVLALFSMTAAPFIMYAEGGLFDLLRKFTGFFNIPIIALVLVGLFSRRITPLAAKTATVCHIILYTLLVFVIKVELNYIHVMGALFVAALFIMYMVSLVKPAAALYSEKYVVPMVDMRSWNKLPAVSTLLIGLLVFAYAFLSPLGIVSDRKEALSWVGPEFKYAMLLLLAGMAGFYYVLKRKMDRYAAELPEERSDAA